ncbi:MAG: DUF1893 domain-containing protein [Erysipelotrichaceae bacterium]|nr:DUF1893 domain-containing protein [Erysipelotrichaceae bacterium]
MNAKDYLTQGVTCALIQNDRLYQAHTSGIQPLMDWLKEESCPLSNGDVADRVVGKTAAMLFRYAGIRSLYAEVISEHALQALKNSNITVCYGKRVPYIINRRHDGMCPMESLVLHETDPQRAYEILKQK